MVSIDADGKVVSGSVYARRFGRARSCEFSVRLSELFESCNGPRFVAE